MGIGDGVPFRLMLGDEVLEDGDEFGFDGGGIPIVAGSGAVIFGDGLEFVIVFEEEGKPLESDVLVEVGAVFALKFRSFLAAGEGVGFNGLFNGVGGIREEDRRGWGPIEIRC